jgi:hypothetical protein
MVLLVNLFTHSWRAIPFYGTAEEQQCRQESPEKQLQFGHISEQDFHGALTFYPYSRLLRAPLHSAGDFIAVQFLRSRKKWLPDRQLAHPLPCPPL